MRNLPGFHKKLTWQPGANTIAYYPLEIDTKDYSGNGRDGTNNGVTFSNGLGVFNGSSYVSLGTGSWTNIQTNMTISVWFRWNGNGSKDNAVLGKSKYNAPSVSDCYYSITIHEEDRYLCGGYYSGSDYNIHPMNFRNTNGGSPTIGPVAQANKWYNVVITNDGNTKKAYVDGVLYATENISSTTSTVSIDTRIGSFVRYNYDSFFNGNISAVIFEDKAWTAEEVAKYYNLTKSDYPSSTVEISVEIYNFGTGGYSNDFCVGRNNLNGLTDGTQQTRASTTNYWETNRKKVEFLWITGNERSGEILSTDTWYRYKEKINMSTGDIEFSIEDISGNTLWTKSGIQNDNFKSGNFYIVLSSSGSTRPNSRWRNFKLKRGEETIIQDSLMSTTLNTNIWTAYPNNGTITPTADYLQIYSSSSGVCSIYTYHQF